MSAATPQVGYWNGQARAAAPPPPPGWRPFPEIEVRRPRPVMPRGTPQDAHDERCRRYANMGPLFIERDLAFVREKQPGSAAIAHLEELLAAAEARQRAHYSGRRPE